MIKIKEKSIRSWDDDYYCYTTDTDYSIVVTHRGEEDKETKLPGDYYETYTTSNQSCINSNHLITINILIKEVNRLCELQEKMEEQISDLQNQIRRKTIDEKI